MQAEVSELAHYGAMGFVDHPHPGQGGDFDDEGVAYTLLIFCVFVCLYMLR